MHPWDDASQKDDPKQLQAIWNALCKGEPAPLIPHKHPRGGHGKGDEEEDSKLLAVMETARVEKHVKSRLAVAADHFNRDYKKGFQFLQVRLCAISPQPVLLSHYTPRKSTKHCVLQYQKERTR